MQAVSSIKNGNSGVLDNIAAAGVPAVRGKVLAGKGTTNRMKKVENKR